LVVVLAAAVVAYCGVLLAGVRRTDRHVDVAEALMGSAMVAMAAPLTVRLPGWWWAGLLAADAAWLAVVLALRVLRVPACAPREHWGHYVHHVLAAVVMVSMAASTGPTTRLLPSSGSAPAMPGMAGGGSSGLLRLLLAGYFFAYTMIAAARLTTAAASDRSPAPGWATPELLNARRVVMGTGMLSMLLVMA
jgi:hypothetical protein